MRYFWILSFWLFATSAVAQQEEKPGFFDRLFGTDDASSDEQQGTLLEQLIADSLSGDDRVVTVTGFVGALSGRATLDSLTIADANGVWLTLNDAVLDWDRGALFRGALDIAELSAGEIRLPRLAAPAEGDAPTPEAQGFQLPELPVSINIGNISAKQVFIGEPVFGAEANVFLNGNLSLAGGEGSAKLTLARLDGRGGVTLEAAYANATGQLAIDLQVEEEPDGILVNLADLPGLPSVDFSITGDAPVQSFKAFINLATDNTERLAGTVTLSKSGDAQRILADISGDIAPVFAPEYRAFFGDAIRLRTDAVAHPDGRFTLADLELETATLQLQGSGELGSDRLPRQIDLTGRIIDQSGAPVLLPIAGNETRVQDGTLKIAFDANRSEDWVGTFELNAFERLDFSADQLTLSGNGQIQSGSTASVSADLSFEAQNADLKDAGLNAALGSDLNGSARVNWADGPVTIDALEINAKSLSANGNATITLTDEGPSIGGTLAVQAGRVADFSTLANRQLGGRADLATRFEVTPLAGRFDIRANGSTENLTIGDRGADAILDGIAQLTASARRDENGLRLTIDQLETDAAQITGQANLRSGGSTFNISGRLVETNLIFPALFGSSTFNAEGQENAARDWAIKAALDGPTLSGSVDGNVADLFETPVFKGLAKVSAEDLSVFSDLAQRRLGGAFDLNFDGQATADLSQFDATATLNGQNLRIGQAEADQLLSGPLSATIEASGTDGRISLRNVTAETRALKASASGVLDGDATDMALSARLADIAPFAAGLSGPLTVDGTLGQSGANYDLDITAVGPAGARADVSGQLAQDFARADLGLSGSAPLGLANRFIKPRSLTGTATFDLGLNGPLGPESLSGQIRTSNARLAAPTLRTALSNIAADVTLMNATANLNVTANVEGGGRLTLNGPVGIAAPNRAELRTVLTRVALSDPRLFETTVDGTVAVTGPLQGGARIAGQLNLGETNVQIPRSGLGGAGEIPEITHLNEPPPVRGTRARAGFLNRGSETGAASTGPAFPIDLTVSAPNRIFVRGRGLDSEFGGSLRLTGTTNNIIPLGAFELVRGRLDILGRRLDLESARITMQGALEPFIQLRASADAEEYKVNVDVTGPATNPDIGFTSNPELPQEEVLARLIFGRGLSALSPLQAARLALAVRTLAGRGGEGVVGRIRNTAGLADLDITTTEDGNAAVRAGAYLGENVYTDITVDSTGETQLNLNLDITPSVTARGGVSNDGETSVGIFFERDY